MTTEDTTDTLTADKAEFVRALLRQNHSERTKRVYQDSLRFFCGWTEEALGRGEHYPVTVDTVLRYIADHLGQMDGS